MFKRISLSLVAAAFLPLVILAQSTINTVAGGGPNKLPAVAASLNVPSGIARDSAGNLYVSVLQDQRVYKIDATGQLTVFAGNGAVGNSGDGGPATQAELVAPGGLAVDSSGNVFIADSGRAEIREVLASTGNIQTVAQIGFPLDVAVDSSGNLFVSSNSSAVISKVSAADGTIQVVAGNGTQGYSGDGGPATAASFMSPQGVYVDGAGNLFITDLTAGVVRKVTASTGIITTVAGNGTRAFSGDGGPATSASLVGPEKAVTDSSGNLFIADGGSGTIREVLASTGIIETVAGTGTVGFSGNGGPATSAQLNQPQGIALDGSGNVFFPDFGNLVVQEVVAATGNLQLIAGNGFSTFSGDGQAATIAQLGFPTGFYVDPSGNFFIADTNNHAIRKVSSATGTIQTIAGTGGTSGFTGDGGLATSATLSFPGGVITDASGNVFIADSGNNVIREVVSATGNIQTVAGNGTAGFTGDGGPAISAQLNFPEDIKVDASGNLLFTDSGNNVIRKVVVATGNIQTIAGTGTAGFSGDGGLATGAELSNPNGLFIDAAGNIFFADTNNNVVREIVAATGNIQTVAGNGTAGFTGDGGPATSAELDIPFAVFVDASGNLFVTDIFNNVIREVVAATGNIQTVAGNGVQDFSGDGGPALSAAIDLPLYLAPGTAGNYYVGDSSNRIRIISPNAVATAPAVQLSANNLSFSANVGATSAAQTVTLTNNGNAALSISSGGIAVSGTNAGDFTETNTCGTSVAAGANCTISVTFTPSAAGTRTASVTITDNAGNSPQSVSLTGAGAAAAPAVTLAPATLTFTSQGVGTTSAAQTITLTNNGNAALSISSGGIAVSGTNAGDFTETNTCGTSVAAGANCTISVTFKPTAAASRTASITITDNAGNSPQSVSLNGSGDDFAVAAAQGGSTSATVAAGQTASYSLQVTATGAAQTVSLSCTGAPQAATCTVPATVNVSPNTPATVNVSVSTTARAMFIPTPRSFRRRNPINVGPVACIVAMLALLFWMLTQRKAQGLGQHTAWVGRLAFAAPMLLLVLSIATMSGCAGGANKPPAPAGTPAGTATITVTATSNGVSHSTQLTLTVQ